MKQMPASHWRPGAIRRATASMVIALAFCLVAPVARASDESPSEAQITIATAVTLDRMHFSHRLPDESLSGQFLENYLDALDGSHLVFLQSDVDDFSWYKPTLSRFTLSEGYTWLARSIYQRGLNRLGQKVQFQTNLLQTAKFSFTGQDTWQLDRQNVKRPSNWEAAHALWRQEVRADYLQEKLAGLTPPQIVELLTRRYERRLKTMQRLDSKEVLDIYLDALAGAYDPNSAYLGREQAQEFEDVMTLSTVGVGGSLAFKNGYWVVADLVPGSPAARSGLLCPGDRILAVAQGDGEFENVTDMPFWRVTDLIRGPKGSTVRLTISPAGMTNDARITVALVREEIKLTEGLANAAIVDWPSANHATVRLGIISLPLFYRQSDSNTFGAAMDTFRLIEKLNREGVKGLMLDLRGNPGGSLPEAVRLAGLFIPSNPVLQTRDAAGRIEIEQSPSCHAIYDGPMVVLTSRSSASAAEIVAGALQDYGRALIVGDSSTYGKGTVQDFVPLGQLLHNPNYGAVKVTVAKFYRPSGTSIQLKGVIPDIVLPSPTDLPYIGEARWPNALPWDTLPPATYTNFNLVRPVLSVLQEKSQARVNSDPGFQLLREELAAANNEAARLTSLNESRRRRDNARADQLDEKMNNLRQAYLAHSPCIYDITLATAGTADLPPARTPGSSATVAPAPNTMAEDDLELREAQSILADYIELLPKAPAEPTVIAGVPSDKKHFAASKQKSNLSIANTEP